MYAFKANVTLYSLRLYSNTKVETETANHAANTNKSQTAAGWLATCVKHDANAPNASAYFFALACRPRMLACTLAAASAASSFALVSAANAVSGTTTIRFDPATNSSHVRSPLPSASSFLKALMRAFLFFTDFLPKNFLASFLFLGSVSAALHSSAETVPSPSLSRLANKVLSFSKPSAVAPCPPARPALFSRTSIFGPAFSASTAAPAAA